jgi:hypothetical protein
MWLPAKHGATANPEADAVTADAGGGHAPSSIELSVTKQQKRGLVSSNLRAKADLRFL